MRVEEDRTVLQVHSEFFGTAYDDPITGSGVFFARRVMLEPGCYAFLVQLQMDADAFGPGDVLRLEAVPALSAGPALFHLTLGAEEAERRLDDFTGGFTLAEPCLVEFRGHMSARAGAVRLRHLLVERQEPGVPVTRAQFFDRRVWLNERWIKAVFIGTTNVCNANCPHCPTNKKMTAHLPRGVMGMELFERIVDQLGAVEIGDGVLFGLFGDPFADPLLAERIRLLRRRRPDLPIDIATNAGLMEVEAAAALAPDVRRISVHMEALTPALYDRLMPPLKAAEVLPRVERLAALAPGRVAVTMPVHRQNLLEAGPLKRFWGARGVPVSYLPLQSRSTHQTAYDRFAAAPVPGFWTADLTTILTIDWDGTVLAICDDFLRRRTIGDLTRQSVAEVLAGPERRAMFQSLRDYRWGDLPFMRECLIDSAAVTAHHAAGPVPGSGEAHTLPPGRFSACGAVTRADGHLHIAPRPNGGVADGWVVFGPYLTLPAGRYAAAVDLRGLGAPGPRFWAREAAVVCEVSADYGRVVYGTRTLTAAELLREPLRFDFHHGDAAWPLEIRIAVRGVPFAGGLAMGGARIVSVDAGPAAGEDRPSAGAVLRGQGFAV